MIRRKGPFVDERRPDAHLLHSRWIDRDRFRFLLAFVDLNHVHPHTVFARRLADLAEQHGGLVILDFAITPLLP